MKTYKAWIIPYGKGTEEVSATVKVKSKKEAYEKLKKDGNILMSNIYLA